MGAILLRRREQRFSRASCRLLRRKRARLTAYGQVTLFGQPGTQAAEGRLVSQSQGLVGYEAPRQFRP